MLKCMMRQTGLSTFTTLHWLMVSSCGMCACGVGLGYDGTVVMEDVALQSYPCREESREIRKLGGRRTKTHMLYHY